MGTYYCLLNMATGYMIGRWYEYEAAENYRNTLDDWNFWIVEEC